MKLNLFGFVIFLIFSLGCSKEIESCDRFDGWTIITEEARGTTCEYQAIYIYNDAYYTVFSCCVCDIIPMAFDCNNEPLCEFGEGCMDRFNRRATYLFSAIEK